jgi:hypothetical protein
MGNRTGVQGRLGRAPAFIVPAVGAQRPCSPFEQARLFEIRSVAGAPGRLSTEVMHAFKREEG